MPSPSDFITQSKIGKTGWLRELYLIAILIFSWILFVVIAIFTQLISNPKILNNLLISAPIPDLEVQGIFLTSSAFSTLLIFLTLGLLLPVLLWATQHILQKPAKTLLTITKKWRWHNFGIGVGIATLSWGIITLFLLFFAVTAHIQPITVEYLLWLPILLIAIALQSTTEEVIFRGYLTQFMFALVKKTQLAITSQLILACIFSAIVFTVLHIGTPILQLAAGFFVYYISISLIWSYATVCSGGVELSSGMHAANNSFVFLIITWSVQPTLAPITLDVSTSTLNSPWLLILAISSPLIITFFALHTPYLKNILTKI